ncbi:MAG: glutathione S-transferase family protein [Gammaproteobacteria bacterium]|nr:glutathione S-transferase family protein [Gammaproteobacteria bacterium]
MIEFWGRKNAYNVQKVSWMLAELELDYRHHDVGSNPGDLETSEMLALNPHARVPLIRDDGAVIWESNTIVRYLAARYGEADLCPRDPFERSLAERWMDWELSKLQPDFLELFWGYYRTPEQDRDEPQLEAAAQRCELHFELLDRHLQHQAYLAGDSFSMGDVPCAVCLYRYFEMGFEVQKPQFVMQWYQRLSQRDAFRAVVMQPFDELKGRVDY